MPTRLILLVASCIATLYCAIHAYIAGSTFSSFGFGVFALLGILAIAYLSRSLISAQRDEIGAVSEPRSGLSSQTAFRDDYRNTVIPQHAGSPATGVPPSTYVPPQASAQSAPPPLPTPVPQMPTAANGRDSGAVGAALGGAVLGGMLGYGIGGAAAAHAAHDGVGRRTRDDGGLLAPIDGDDLDQGTPLGNGPGAPTSSGLLPPIDDDDPSIATSTGILPPVDSDTSDVRGSGLRSPVSNDQHVSGPSGILDPVDADELTEHDPSPAPQEDEDAGYRGATGLLSPISSEDAETRRSPEPDPYRYDPPARDPVPEPDSSWGGGDTDWGGGSDD